MRSARSLATQSWRARLAAFEEQPCLSEREASPLRDFKDWKRSGSADPQPDASSLVTVGESLVTLHDWTFLLGPGFVVGIGNGLILGYLMYRSGLVPRGMAILGLIAGPMLLARFVGILFGVFEPMSVLGGIMVVPEFIWELSLGVWLIVKGFKPSAVASLSTEPDDGVLTGVDQPAVVPSNGHATSNG